VDAIFGVFFYDNKHLSPISSTFISSIRISYFK